MSKHRFTAGPWRIARDEQSVSFIVYPIEATIPFVPLDAESDEQMDGFEAEALANARLVAASPALLAACEAMLAQRYSTWHRFAEEDEPEPDDMQLARAAIAAATGEMDTPIPAPGDGAEEERE